MTTDKEVHKPFNGNVYKSQFLQHMDPAMRPDREMAEVETDVSRGVQRELRRVGT